ncbi:peptidoglycan DD-metalloendopeptidase family protein [Mesobacillus subterraneus]|uniref:M23 family metallopeptidase n=1 Tax=Mesobacillus subterraneus TaxID=285983 RepID=UPI002042277C|nr:M23 family metallopeptidase [Mesobacillus subterraneus]MCM3664468.1 peptidoglycan DD-metalloendopeptidase family protein [Mesobacillus subterraneus]MCM3684015.1 peptidoglycan DD-metalloendopeptidase family protein [Mesobacillus subterraneus]
MINFKNKLSSLAGKTSREMKPAIRKSIMAAVTVAALSFGAGSAAHAANSKLTTVYYVYVNDKFAGTVADKTEVEKLVEDKLASVQKEYKDLDVELGLDVSFVPEQVFSSAANANTSEVLNVLKNQMTVQAEASALAIDGKPVAYLKDEEASKKVVKTLMLEYVTEEELAEVENRRKSPNLPIPEVKENETRILDVRFTQNVSTSAEKVNPEQILTVEEALQLLKKGTLEEQKYQVKDGDVLGSIASSHNLELAQLLTLNEGFKEDSVLKPGQELNVTVLKPFVEVIVDRQTYVKEEVAFQKEVVADASMFKGDTKKKQEGKIGINGVIYGISEQNGKVVKKETLKKVVLQEPVKEIVVKGTKVVPSRGDGTFVWPTNGGYVSSQQGYRWNKMHKGIDIARPSNYTIKAADNGVVVSAGYDNGGYGNKIIIDHQNGYRTMYAHLASISVSVGQTVSRGSKIGIMGRTGNSTGVHLHFEVYQNGKLIDPMSKLNRK